MCFGMIYRLTNRNYHDYLVKITEGGGADLENYGEVIKIHVAKNVTDITPEEAAEELEWLLRVR
jgi:hypothetical protein